MKMLILRSGRHFDQLRACVPIVRTKTRKYGQVLDEHWLPTRRDWMILGANAAGKTRWLQRLHSHAPAKPALLLRRRGSDRRLDRRSTHQNVHGSHQRPALEQPRRHPLPEYLAAAGGLRGPAMGLARLAAVVRPGQRVHWFCDALTVSGPPVGWWSDRRITLFGGRVKTGSMAELAITVAIVAPCAIVIYTKREVPGSLSPSFTATTASTGTA